MVVVYFTVGRGRQSSIFYKFILKVLREKGFNLRFVQQPAGGNDELFHDD